MRRKKTTLDRLVDEIAVRVAQRLLRTTGSDQVAGRLVQETNKHLDGPGWCRKAIEDQVRDAIREASR